MDNAIKRVNKNCAHFPCHDGLEDCTFCFCPLYPCRDEARGKYVFSRKQNKPRSSLLRSNTTKQEGRGKRIWSCRSCNWIHQKAVVDEISQSIRDKEAVLNAARYLKNQAHTGVVILAHGSKIDATKDTVRGVTELLKQNLKLKYILPAYLQFCQPTLSESIRELIRKGCRKIIIVPYFLFNGNHVLKDIPSLIQKEKEKFPGVELLYAKALAEDEEKISAIITQRIEEVV